MRHIFKTLTGSSLLFLGSMTALAIPPGKWAEVGSTDGSANIRATPGGQVIDTLPNDTLVNIESVDGVGWTRINGFLFPERLQNFSTDAYVRSSQLWCPGGVFHWCVVSGSDGSANVRATRDLEGQVIQVLQNGDAVRVVESKGDWYKLGRWGAISDATAYPSGGYAHISVLTPSVFFGGVPYYCQLLNDVKPSSTCGNTSLAMAVSAVTGKSISADFLWSYNEREFGYNFANSRDRFAQIAKSLGATGSRAAILTEAEMKSEIDQGRLLVMQGYFTNSYGHIVLIVGYNDKGFIVNDPYGKWNGGYTGSGYWNCSSGNATGKRVVYPYAEIRGQSLLNPKFSVGVISK